MLTTRSLFAVALVASLSVNAETLTVTNSQSIQDAIKRGKSGDTIRVMPGTYKESIYIDKDNIRLSGVIEGDRWPTLDGENTLSDGVLVSGHNVTIENLYVKRYLGNGIMTQGANNFAILHNRVEGPGFYGIFPQYGQNGLVAHNVVSGINGTGVYIGMSRNLDIVHNEAADNGAFGIEAENSDHLLIEGNYAHGNEIGVVLNLIPGLPIKKEEYIVVRNNFIIGNGRNAKSDEALAESNAAIDSGTGEHPGGTGLLINGGDSNTIEGNLFSENPGAAIFVMDHNFGQMFPVPDPKVDPYPDDNRILRNMFVSNGQHPYGRTLRVLETLKKTQAPDLLMAGQGRRNCVLSKSELATLGAEKWSECPAGTNSGELVTMRLSKPVMSGPLTLAQKGRLTFLAVCTGCHSFSTRITGPPMVAARAPYMGDPQRFADWIAHPTKRRDDYPTIPHQSYLPADVRLEVARYVLGLKGP
jgi:parallel beta-helix repeat protein